MTTPEPTPYWTRGTRYIGAQRTAVWTREHGTWDDVKAKGSVCGQGDVVFYPATDGADGVIVQAFRRGATMTPIAHHGEHFPDTATAYAAAFGWGYIGVCEVSGSRRPAAPAYDRYQPDPDDAAYENRNVDQDPSGTMAEGAAADMVYGR